jgi:hypothetical protein
MPIFFPVVTGLVVLLYRRFDESYFNLLFVHVVAGGIAMGIVPLALLLLTRKRGRWERALVWLAAAFCLLSFVGGSPVVFLLPLTISIWALSLVWLRHRSLRPMGTVLFFFQLASACGIASVIGKQANLSGEFHGLWGLLALAAVVWTLFEARPRPRSRRVFLDPAVIAAATAILLLVGIWAHRNFAPLDKQYFYSQTPNSPVSQTDRPAPSALLRSAVCGAPNCHPLEYEQWAGSTHRFASNNRLFRRIVKLAEEDGGKEGARECVNCHDPVATLTTAGLESWPDREPGADQGVNCQVCHLMRGGDLEKGDGYVKLAREIKYPYQDSPPGTPGFEKFKRYVFLDPRRHIKNYQPRNVLNKSDYCLPCHLITVARPADVANPLRLHLLYSQWRRSDWGSQLNCQDCHLPIFQITPFNYYSMDHRFLGISTVQGQLAYRLENADPRRITEQIAYTKEYLAGALDPHGKRLSADPNQLLTWVDFPRKALPIQAQFLRGSLRQGRLLDYLDAGSSLQVRLKTDGPRFTPGTPFTLHIQTTNARVGHDVPSGPIDMVRCWCEVTVRDSEGRIVQQKGGLDENGDVLPGTPYFGCLELLDAEGRPIRDHRFWRAAEVSAKRVLPAFSTVDDEITISLAEAVGKAVVIEARWRYLRINKTLWNMAFDGDGPPQSPLELGGATIEIPAAPITTAPNNSRAPNAPLLASP